MDVFGALVAALVQLELLPLTAERRDKLGHIFHLSMALSYTAKHVLGSSDMALDADKITRRCVAATYYGDKRQRHVAGEIVRTLADSPKTVTEILTVVRARKTDVYHSVGHLCDALVIEKVSGKYEVILDLHVPTKGTQ